ncbi:O-antigen ligase family protein [Sphingomonas baiyangensis]|uniref:O-antigen ligase family protein n=1 Tax=Sphingomonas baiyangensis TaxID=2572576 RepID=A0A4U1L1G2_9SPHN|nr:O-antigen ligase family protein [Sphingomonas baiyangensis]TKD50314.1 O-antigen ligase family protein [Sphingomonas baiyangensis]
MKALRVVSHHAEKAFLAFVLLAVVLGGSGRAAFANLFLQLAAIALIAIAAWRLRGIVPTRALRWSFLLLAAIIALPLVQLIRLDPDIWRLMPDRGWIAEGFAQLDVDAPWLGISLTPGATLAAWFHLLPPVAAFLFALTLDPRGQRRALGVLLVAAMISLALGTLQFAAASPSLHFHAISNVGSATGFFANRNHLATLLLMAMPASATLIATWRVDRKGDAIPQRRRWLLAGPLLLLLFSGLLMTGSRAGFGLGIAAMLLSLLIVRRGSGGGLPVSLALVAAVTCVAVIVLAYVSGLGTRAVAEAASLSTDELRIVAAPITAELGWRYFPFGSGFGSFETMFKSAGGAVNLGQYYVNHAHNDYLELWLEAGAAGIVVIVGFLILWLGTTRLHWRAPPGDAATLGKAASMAVGLVLLHSVVDFPLRTLGAAVPFAMMCAFALAASVGVATPARHARGELRIHVRNATPQRA